MVPGSATNTLCSFGETVERCAGVDSDDRTQRDRVGSRTRAVSWRDSVAQAFQQNRGGDHGGTIPVNLALVPVMAKEDDFGGAR